MLVYFISRLFSKEISAENVHNAKLAQLGKSIFFSLICLCPGCSWNVCNGGESKKSLSRRWLPMGRRGRQDGWGTNSRIEMLTVFRQTAIWNFACPWLHLGIFFRSMPDQTECERWWLTGLRRTSQVHDLESKGAHHSTWEKISLTVLVALYLPLGLTKPLQSNLRINRLAKNLWDFSHCDSDSWRAAFPILSISLDLFKT